MERMCVAGLGATPRPRTLGSGRLAYRLVTSVGYSDSCCGADIGRAFEIQISAGTRLRLA